MGHTCGWHMAIQRREATKKAGGTTKNNPGSPGKRLGLKKWEDSLVKPGNIIVRQRGRRYWEGENVGCSKDFTLWALVEGRVFFEKIWRTNGKRKTVVHVYPLRLSNDCIQYRFESDNEQQQEQQPK